MHTVLSKYNKFAAKKTSQLQQNSASDLHIDSEL